MTHFSTTHRPTWVALYLLAAAATVLALIALTQSYVGGLIFVVGVILSVLLYRISNGARLSPSRVSAQSSTYDYHHREPMIRRTLLTADGQVRGAWVVPMERMRGHELLLTADGYILVDETGRVIRTFNG